MIPLLTIAGARWVVALAGAVERRSGWTPRLRGGGSPPGGCAVHQPGRTARDRRRRRAAAAARPEARHVPARRLRPPATVDRRAGWRSCRGATEPFRLVGHALRAGTRREDRPRRRPALVAAGHRHAEGRPRRGRSSPRSTCPGTGSTATVLHIGRIRIGAGATSARAARCSPARGSASAPRSHPVRAWSGSVPTGQRWAGVPATRRARPRARWPSPPPAALALLDARCTASRRSRSALLPSLAALPAAPALRAAAAGHAARPRCGTCRSPRRSGSARTRCSCWSLVRLLGIGLREGYHPVHSRVGVAGVDDRAADEQRTHRPVPAVRLACSRPCGCGCSA